MKCYNCDNEAKIVIHSKQCTLSIKEKVYLRRDYEKKPCKCKHLLGCESCAFAEVRQGGLYSGYSLIKPATLQQALDADILLDSLESNHNLARCNGKARATLSKKISRGSVIWTYNIYIVNSFLSCDEDKVIELRRSGLSKYDSWRELDKRRGWQR